MNMSDDVPVYINESLTVYRKRVFGAAKDIKKNKGYKYLWLRGGKILIRKDEGSPAILLKTLEDVPLL